jgi:hypothetical protein
MLIDYVGRWRDRVGCYRPAREVIDPRVYAVEELHDDTTPRDFIRQHHYIGTMPAARFRFGLFWGGLLVGVAVFSHPANDAVLSIFPGLPLESCELGRFVLLDRVEANGESWMLARCFAELRKKGVVGVVSFADPVRRTDGAGRVVAPGHLGMVYQATNARYLGRTRAENRRLLPNGAILHNRTLANLRARDQGWRYVAAMLEAQGASRLGDKDVGQWLAEWLPRLTRPLHHSGNLRYAWGLTEAVKDHLGDGQPYPKLVLPDLVGAEGGTLVLAGLDDSAAA